MKTQAPANTVTPKTLVYNFDHCSFQQYDVHDPGQEDQHSAPRYYHIITPLKKTDRLMYRYDLTGYAYGLSRPLDILWIGYVYPPRPNAPIYTFEKNMHPEDINISYMSQYYRRDGSLVLVFGPINRYCNGFSLYFQGHFGDHHEKGANPSGYSMIVRTT